MQLKQIVGTVLVVLGVVLLIMGIHATDSFSSQFSNFFTGSPTDHAVWLILGGVAAILAGGMLAMQPFRTIFR
jgi:uncharacterized membrane protein